MWQDWTALFAVAVAVGMDAMVVALSNALLYKNLGAKRYIIALTFALFQSIMPLVGSLIAFLFGNITDKWGHWIAFALLIVMGVNTIVQTAKENTNKKLQNGVTVIKEHSNRQLTMAVIIVQAFATSIDAMAVGLTLTVTVSINIWICVIVIGLVTFAMCMCAMQLYRIANIFRQYAGYISGIILCAIAIKILIENIM